MSHDPAAVYRDRLTAQRAALARLEQVDAWFAHARIGTFALSLVTGLFVWRTDLTPWALLAPVVIFLLLMARHDRTIRARNTAARAVAYYERGLARIEDRWIGIGDSGTRFIDEEHPYSEDLNLFGPASLFELLSTARTNVGAEVLARWLTSSAATDVIHARQRAVAELAPAIALREAVATSGENAAIGVDVTGLRTWASQQTLRRLPHLRIATYVTAAATTAGTVFLIVTGGLLPLQVLFVFQLMARYVDGERIERILDVAGGKSRELDTLSQLFLLLESAPASAPRLVSLRAMVGGRGAAASRAIRSLQRLSERHAWGHSLPIVPVVLFLYGVSAAPWAIGASLVAASAVLLFNPFLAVAVERWRQVHSQHVGEWIAALAEYEATIALAAYHFEHPDDPFPVIEDEGLRPVALFDGVELGHPLVPLCQMVRNDVKLTSGMQLLVVSGSNMSGKSTLLRSVGVNAVLALAGAPVRATSLRISPLAIGATLRIQDSLREGRSRFFAEITRIRLMADLAGGEMPLLFLIDEMLHGTNSHDRLIGASGILRALLARGAIGLITTHDLALTAIVSELSPRAANVHFEDVLEDGEMRFDYRVKPGPVTRTNALALMRAVGLKMPAPD